MPNASCSALTTGARQFVVQDAFETILCSALRMSSFTPSTIVASISSFAGADRRTRFAPAFRCISICSRLRKTPVDSSTTSTPSLPQGSFDGSFSAVTLTSSPSTTIPSPETASSPA